MTQLATMTGLTPVTFYGNNHYPDVTVLPVTSVTWNSINVTDASLYTELTYVTGNIGNINGARTA
jgi:hypothetical protein